MKKSANSDAVGASSRSVVFPPELAALLQRLDLAGLGALSCATDQRKPLDPAAELAHHRKALDDFSRGNYFEAHEEWEASWRNYPLESPGRHAFQALIRLCAAGVKGQEGHGRGYAHHLKGAQSHLETALIFVPVDAVAWQSWRELLNHLKSLPTPNA